MITIEEAFKIINKTIQKSEIVQISLNDSLGYVLSNNILSEINMPPFNQSAMDGYAINSTANSPDETAFKLIDEIKAGDDASKIELKPKEAIRIFTGAMVPKGTTHIAQQEIVTSTNGNITISKELKENANIRLKGEQIVKGANVCPEGTVLNAGTIGYLATLGVKEVNVYQRPDIGILNTGDELQASGEALNPGKVYESNGIMLSSLLSEMRLTSSRQKVKDGFEETKSIIDKLSKEHDILIITGGISVGDYDFVGSALNALNSEKYFYKVKQKPGKPLFYGKVNNCYVFALPGNPAAVITCFHMYVKPAIQLFSGLAVEQIRPSIQVTLAHDYHKKGDRPVFLKAFIDNDLKVSFLSHQSSAMLNSFVQANCFAFIQAQTSDLKRGESVRVYPFLKN